MSKKCSDCKFFDEPKSYCFLTDDPVDIPATSNACPDFEQRTQTLFDRITASPEVLARTYMFNYDGKEFKSLLFPNMVFNSREEAIAATVAKLKEVCDE